MGILNLWGGPTFEGIDKFDKEVETPKTKRSNLARIESWISNRGC